MRSFCYTITDIHGIHARPACQLAKLAGSFGQTTVTIMLGSEQAEATEVMDVMGLGVKKEDQLTIEIAGEQETACHDALKTYFEMNL